jgi:hypothetical protein
MHILHLNQTSPELVSINLLRFNVGFLKHQLIIYYTKMIVVAKFEQFQVITELLYSVIV